jgi:hypothetical protein
MCAAARSAAGLGVAANPARHSCPLVYITFSEGEMRLRGQRAGGGRRDDGRRTGVGSRGRGRLRSGARQRASLPLTTAFPPRRLPLGRHGAYTIPQASILISTIPRLLATTSTVNSAHALAPPTRTSTRGCGIRGIGERASLQDYLR